jgi:hypothetical protein
MNTFDRINDSIRNTEASLVNLLSAIAPWGAPLAPAYMAYGGMTARLDYAPWVALVIAGVIEILGLATIYTALSFWRHNRRYTAEYKRMPVEIAGACFAFYLLVVLTVNVLLELPELFPYTPVVARALLSLLSVPAAITLAIRVQHTELLREIEQAKSKPKHTEAPRPVLFACSVCSEQFTKQKALNGHMLKHRTNGNAKAHADADRGAQN